MCGTDDIATPSDQQITEALYVALHDGLHSGVDAMLPDLVTNAILALLVPTVPVIPAQSLGC